MAHFCTQSEYFVQLFVLSAFLFLFFTFPASGVPGLNQKAARVTAAAFRGILERSSWHGSTSTTRHIAAAQLHFITAPRVSVPGLGAYSLGQRHSCPVLRTAWRLHANNRLNAGRRGAICATPAAGDDDAGRITQWKQGSWCQAMYAKCRLKAGEG